MFQEIQRNNGQATSVVFNLKKELTSGDFVSAVFASGDVKLIKHSGGTWNTTTLGDPSAIAGTLNYEIDLTANQMWTDEPQYPMIIQIIDQTGPKVWDDLSIKIWVKETPANLIAINDIVNAQAELTIKNLHIQATDGDAITLYSQEGNAVTMTAKKGGVAILSDSNGIDITANDTGINIVSGGYGIISKEFDLIEAMIKGRITKDPITGLVNVYARNNSDVLFTMLVTSNERARAEG